MIVVNTQLNELKEDYNKLIKIMENIQLKIQ